jgi:hypothetical protein
MASLFSRLGEGYLRAGGLMFMFGVLLFAQVAMFVGWMVVSKRQRHDGFNSDTLSSAKDLTSAAFDDYAAQVRQHQHKHRLQQQQQHQRQQQAANRFNHM